MFSSGIHDPIKDEHFVYFIGDDHFHKISLETGNSHIYWGRGIIQMLP